MPESVCSVEVDVYGAQGGDSGGGAYVGGFGGRATADLAVTPGETLVVYVGGRPGGSNTGGFNGGGDAGISTNNDSQGRPGGGGSDVRQGGSDLADRVVVAGGGGGISNGGDSGGAGGGGAPEGDADASGAGAGGGGSGHGPEGTTLATGVREGHGQITITYDLAASTCPADETTTTTGSVATTPVAGTAQPRFTG